MLCDFWLVRAFPWSRLIGKLSSDHRHNTKKPAVEYSSWKPKLICGVIALSFWALCSYLPDGLQTLQCFCLASLSSWIGFQKWHWASTCCYCLCGDLVNVKALLKLATGQVRQQAGEKAETPSRRKEFPPHSLSPSTGLFFWHAKKIGTKTLHEQKSLFMQNYKNNFYSPSEKKRNIYSICRCQSLKTRNHKLAF